MKRINHIYEKIDKMYIIINQYEETIRKNTKNKRAIARFEEYYTIHMAHIKELIESKSYHPGKYRIFLVQEPKIRLVMSQDLEDKTINHLVAKYLIRDIFEPQLIEMNIATRVGKGTHIGITSLSKYLQNMIRTNKPIYYLKFDIKKYFYSIDHEIVKEIIRKKIKDQDALHIIEKIIDSTDEPYVNETIQKIKTNKLERNISDHIKQEVEDIPFYQKGKGLPIGNMTSQILAILYLNELDHFIKEKLGIKYYIRYMDDGILLHEDKEYLKYCLQEIEKIIKKYKLTLNPKKTKVHSIKNGIEFLGFQYKIKNNHVIRKVRNDTKKRFKKKMKSLQKNKVSKKEEECILASYLGHLKWGDCKQLISKNPTRIKPKNGVKAIQLNDAKMAVIDNI